MTDRPILMSAPMVRAILSGSKTQTRRVVKAPGWTPGSGEYTGRAHVGMSDDKRVGLQAYFEHRETQTWHGVRCPYGSPSDRLWVREAFAIVPRTAYRCSEGVQQTLRPDDDHDAAIYREGWTRSRGGFSWKPSIHMPRWASRITLEITDVRVQRLQDISESDALSEGIVPTNDGYGLPDGSHYHAADPRVSYWSLWDAINGQGSTESNPWVWAVSFRRVA